MSAQHRRDEAPADPEDLFDRLARGGDPKDAVGRALAAARPEPLTQETEGERLALAAFREAKSTVRAGSRVQPRHRRRGVARSLALAAGVVVIAGGGVAVASAAGIGPHLLGGHQGTTPTAGATSGSTPIGGHSPHPSAAPSTPSLSTTPSRSADPPAKSALVAQCRAYEQLPARYRNNALDDPSYADLVSAAHSKGRVKAYCDALLGIPKAPASPTAPAATGHPTHPGHPTPPAAASPNSHSSH